jgi:4-hydroxybenzoate polyprenyltransferase
VGGGLVISPNQTITLSEVPVEQAGTAGGLLQTGQRIGSAIGVAAVGAVFFARVASSGGHGYPGAFQSAVLVSVAFVAAALIITLVDITIDRRHRRRL